MDSSVQATSNSLNNLNLLNFNLSSNNTANEITQKGIQELLEWYRNRTIYPGGAINNTGTGAKIDTATCTYCDGLVWESFTDYRAVHGYLTLVVRLLRCFFACKIVYQIAFYLLCVRYASLAP